MNDPLLTKFQVYFWCEGNNTSRIDVQINLKIEQAGAELGQAQLNIC